MCVADFLSTARAQIAKALKTLTSHYGLPFAFGRLFFIHYHVVLWICSLSVLSAFTCGPIAKNYIPINPINFLQLIMLMKKNIPTDDFELFFSLSFDVCKSLKHTSCISVNDKSVHIDKTLLWVVFLFYCFKSENFWSTLLTPFMPLNFIIST